MRRIMYHAFTMSAAKYPETEKIFTVSSLTDKLLIKKWRFQLPVKMKYCL